MESEWAIEQVRACASMGARTPMLHACWPNIAFTNGHKMWAWWGLRKFDELSSGKLCLSSLLIRVISRSKVVRREVEIRKPAGRQSMQTSGDVGGSDGIDADT